MSRKARWVVERTERAIRDIQRTPGYIASLRRIPLSGAIFPLAGRQPVGDVGDRVDVLGRASPAGHDGVGVLDGDLVAEEPCRAAAGMGDRRLLFGQLQLENLSQELPESAFDRLGLGFRSGEPTPAVLEPCL